MAVETALPQLDAQKTPRRAHLSRAHRSCCVCWLFVGACRRQKGVSVLACANLISATWRLKGDVHRQQAGQGLRRRVDAAYNLQRRCFHVSVQHGSSRSLRAGSERRASEPSRNLRALHAHREQAGQWLWRQGDRQHPGRATVDRWRDLHVCLQELACASMKVRIEGRGSS